MAFIVHELVAEKVGGVQTYLPLLKKEMTS